MLQVEPAVSHDALPGGKMLIHAGLDIKNISPIGAQIAVEAENVYGISYGAAMRRSDSTNLDRSRIETYSLPPVRQVLLAAYLSVDKPAGGTAESFYASGREKRFATALAVPQGAFDAVRIDYGVCYRRLDDKRVYPYRPKRLADGALHVTMMPSLLAGRMCVFSHNVTFAL